MRYESSDDYKIYGKTGGGVCWDNKIMGQYVGFVDTELGPI